MIFKALSSGVAHECWFTNVSPNSACSDHIFALSSGEIISLEKIAEQKFQLQEQMLAKKLKGMEDKIRTLTQNNQNESDILSPETLKAIEGFKSEMMSTRSQLRTVKFDLRRDVEALKKWIISINVAILPIFFASIALLISLRRRRKNSY